jgi:hypothetical protein
MAALSDIRSELSSEPVSPIQSTLRRRLCVRLTVISPEAGTLINDCPETTKGRGYGLQRVSLGITWVLWRDELWQTETTITPNAFPARLRITLPFVGGFLLRGLHQRPPGSLRELQ